VETISAEEKNGLDCKWQQVKRGKCNTGEVGERRSRQHLVRIVLSSLIEEGEAEESR